MERVIEFGKCLETEEMTKSLEYGRERVIKYGKCLETGETTKFFDYRICLKTRGMTKSLEYGIQHFRDTQTFHHIIYLSTLPHNQGRKSVVEDPQVGE